MRSRLDLRNIPAPQDPPEASKTPFSAVKVSMDTLPTDKRNLESLLGNSMVYEVLRKSSRQSGFTITELMIATAVFSTILLIVITAVAQIGRIYYKGVTTARTQEVSRTIVDRIAQQIQFSAATPSTTITGLTDGADSFFCIDSTRYVLRANRQVSETPSAAQSRHGLWTDNGGGSGTACNLAGTYPVDMNNAVASAEPGGADLVPIGMRVVDFVLSPNAALTAWNIKIRVVYGDNELIETTDGTPQATNLQKTICKGSQVGSQFCAVSEIETTVVRRVF